MAELSYIEWHNADTPPELDNWAYASVRVLADVEERSGEYKVIPLRYQRTIVRKKRVERWEDEWGRIYYGKVVRWAYYPQSPEVV